MEAANVLDIRDSVVFRGDFSRCTRWFRSVPLRLRKNTRQRPRQHSGSPWTRAVTVMRRWCLLSTHA